MLWLYMDKSRLQGIPQSFYGGYPKYYLSWEFSNSIQNMVGHDLLLLMLKIETSTPGTNSMPFLVFRRDHLRSTSRIICGPIWGSLAVWGSFAVGDHLRRCTVLTTPWVGVRVCHLLLLSFYSCLLSDLAFEWQRGWR